MVVPEASVNHNGGDLETFVASLEAEELRQWAEGHVVTARDMIDILHYTIKGT